MRDFTELSRLMDELAIAGEAYQASKRAREVARAACDAASEAVTAAHFKMQAELDRLTGLSVTENHQSDTR